jgi:hypothetical protein
MCRSTSAKDIRPDRRPNREIRRPAAIDRQFAGALVEQGLADVAPDCMRSIKSDRIETLNLDTTSTPSAFDPEQFARDLR